MASSAFIEVKRGEEIVEGYLILLKLKDPSISIR
jgi:hypothetical protein